MTDERDESNDPSNRALGRWESEGGAPKGGRYVSPVELRDDFSVIRDPKEAAMLVQEARAALSSK
jgi:hypothetical protein